MDNEFKEPLALFKEASDHLDYCGYGDSWERECAGDLRDRVQDMLSKCEERRSRILSDFAGRRRALIKRGYGCLLDVELEGDYVVSSISFHGGVNRRDKIHRKFFDEPNTGAAVAAYDDSRDRSVVW